MSDLLRPYCTLADVQNFIGNSQSDITSLLQDSINQASRMVEDMCGRWFWFLDYSSTAYTVPRPRVVGNIILLPFEVLTLTEVAIDGVVQASDTYDYRAGERTIVRVYGSGVSSSYDSSTSQAETPVAIDWLDGQLTGTITVKGTFGYALETTGSGEGATPVITVPPPLLPYQIRRATMQIAAAISGQWRKERVSLDGQRDSILETRIPTEVDGLLKKYKVSGELTNF